MAYISIEQLQSPVEGADIWARPKDNGLGFHWGTGLSTGMIKDTMPEIGKRITTLETFCDGKPCFGFRPERTAEQKAEVEMRALMNMLGAYNGVLDNCEHDMNFAQTGVAVSPTVEAVKTGALWLGGGLLALKIIEAFSNGRR
jgi:hypothetical protein